MRVREFIDRLRRLHRSESGTAMTEFVMFLPIWIVVFIGIINLGRIGIVATKVQVQAQQDLWKKATKVTKGVFDGDEFMIPRVAAVTTGEKYTAVGNKPKNPQGELDIAEGVTMGAGMELYGHYGEAYQRTVLLQPVMQNGIELHGPVTPAKDVLGVPKDRYPHLLLNDTLVEQSFSGGWTGILESAVKASGLIPSLAAGIRYGSVFAEREATAELLGGAVDVKTASHWDVMVAPRPITGAAGTSVTFGVAFLAAKLDDNYMHYQQFGKTNWGGKDGKAKTDSADEGDIRDDAEKERKKKCKEIEKKYDSDPDDDPDTPPPSSHNGVSRSDYLKCKNA